LNFPKIHESSEGETQTKGIPSFFLSPSHRKKEKKKRILGTGMVFQVLQDERSSARQEKDTFK
jgi:hypothetical protein